MTSKILISIWALKMKYKFDLHNFLLYFFPFILNNIELEKHILSFSRYIWKVQKLYFSLNVEAAIQILKVIFNRSVGKSSLAIQFVQGQFVDYYEPTIENTFNKTINIKGSVTSVVESEETEVDCSP